MSYHHITKTERSEIEHFITKGYSNRSIGKMLKISHTTIGRERKNNKTSKGYDSEKAQQKARNRRKCSKYQGMKMEQNRVLRSYVIEGLMMNHTPEVIAGRIREIDTHIPSISAKGIYKWLYSAFGQAYCRYIPSHRYKPKKRAGLKKKREMIPKRVSITERSEQANNRTEYGHCEEDTIVSGRRHHSTVSLAVLEERMSRYVQLRKIPCLKPSVHRKAVQKMLQNIPSRLSSTFDNGIENKEHALLAKDCNISTYFCDPYCSWQKGAVENTNGRIRRFIPKGANIADYSDKEIAAIEHWLNHTPRKCLNYRTPYEMMILLSSTCHLRSGALEG